MKSLADNKAPSPLFPLSMFYLGVGSLLFSLILYRYWSTTSFQYLIFALLALIFIVTQLIGLHLSQWRYHQPKVVWITISTLLMCILVIPNLIHDTLSICMVFLGSIPLYVAAAGQLKQLPSVFFWILVVAAATIFVDLTAPVNWRLMINRDQLWRLVGIGALVYLGCLCLVFYQQYQRRSWKQHLQINLATQYVLVFTGISAMVIILVTGVMIGQIRVAQINQAGKTFQTIAENFAKLVGAHLEQQTQKLKLLTEQVPIFKEGLIRANGQYPNRTIARKLLAQKNLLWEGPKRNDAFVMNYLNNPIIRALSRFRGHNNFHNDIVLVDSYGGLVASLGKKPEQFYFYDQNWWRISWNSGLGNAFIGDLMLDERTKVPKLRIAVDIIDHTTNEVIGMLSSMYLLRTLLEDVQRFKPDTVDQISLTNAQGQVIVSTTGNLVHQHVWPHIGELNTSAFSSDSGWAIGRDHRDQAALIGFSSLSTAYSVISDPLRHLGWHFVVSGTRSNALISVTQSTKLAMLVGLAAMALGVLGAIAAARVITRPIENLTAITSAMSDGDLHQYAQLAGPEELIALSVGFNQLTDRLRSVIQNLKSQATQLTKAKGEAEAATKLKGEFLANMSHEIRTPLNAILGFADILEFSIEDEKKKRHVQTIKSSGADLLHLINDILDLSKIEAGRMEIQVRPVHLQKMFDELQRIFSINAEEKMIHIEMTVDPELPAQLMLDRVRLRQVLSNLIGNAVKFTDQGAVRCVAHGKPAKQENHWDLVIDVYDSGIGIDPDVYGKIFESFKQHHEESHTTFEGSGLGLAISKNLIEMMGGCIEVEGAPGKGSLFSIFLPKIMSAHGIIHLETEMTESPFYRAVRFEPATILVADDLEVNRRHIVEALNPCPFKISLAEHGEAAVTLALNKRFDLILMDIRMPGMDGYDALKKIQRHYHASGPTVIATTAAGMKEDIAQIEQAGFDDYLIRPFDQDALVQLLMRYLPNKYKREETKPVSSLPPMIASHIKAEQTWTCPPEAHAYVFKTLKMHWEQVTSKQSIPDIISFANEVMSVGDRYGIEILSLYGRELGDCAESFDIHNMEKLLRIYDVILSCHVNDSEKEKVNEE